VLGKIDGLQKVYVSADRHEFPAWNRHCDPST
jgi:hypothetical protein